MVKNGASKQTDVTDLFRQQGEQLPNLTTEALKCKSHPLSVYLLDNSTPPILCSK